MMRTFQYLFLTSEILLGCVKYFIPKKSSPSVEKNLNKETEPKLKNINGAKKIARIKKTLTFLIKIYSSYQPIS